jgi:hypothetical protein
MRWLASSSRGARILSFTVSRTVQRWFVSFTVDVERIRIAIPSPGRRSGPGQPVSAHPDYGGARCGIRAVPNGRSHIPGRPLATPA